MFLLFPYTCLFTFFLFLSTVMIISSPNWLMAWLSMELNLLSFIPMMMSSKSLRELESTTKYFFAQSLGSILILLSAFSAFPGASNLTLLGLLLKLGLAPLHFWFPATMTGISWEMCMLISTWQKFPILALLSLLSPSHQTLFLITSGLSVMVAGIMGLNQTQLRTLLAYSSIAHTGWVMALMSLSSSASWIYFCIYVMITLSTMMFLKESNALFFWSTNHAPFLLLLLFLSLSGLPPFSGFAIKLGAISLLSTISIPFTILMILGSLLSLYFYLSLSFNFLFRSFYPLMKTLNTTFAPSLLISLSLFSFLLTSNLFLFY
uniref:NADH-ubiquinone oxidoreductase chain 2 n=1 Tax=Phascolosoma pacificum TaxID=1634976 RepID=A0A1D8BET9_9ANNE|nr:NADH dehydrogenase subunit 2 [Phascolosoma pacificum]AOS53048.1 NADH dehydrogenase subunit 2 [Phascolosoma pacificum]